MEVAKIHGENHPNKLGKLQKRIVIRMDDCPRERATDFRAMFDDTGGPPMLPGCASGVVR